MNKPIIDGNTPGQWKGNRKKLFFKISLILIVCGPDWYYRRSLLQFLLVPQTVLGSRETLKQIITRAGCWICLNIALNVGFTFWKYKHISQYYEWMEAARSPGRESQHFGQQLCDLTTSCNDGLTLQRKCKIYFLGTCLVTLRH